MILNDISYQYLYKMLIEKYPNKPNYFYKNYLK